MTKQPKLYRVADRVTQTELLALGFDTHGDMSKIAQAMRQIRAVTTGEFRPPKQGEFYLSGAIAEAYRAPNDFTSTYHIARLVKIRETLVVEIVQ